MRKNVWIMNHYATEMFYNQGGRHYWFAENLLKQGYNPTVFCANTFHFKDDIIDLGNTKYRVDTVNGIPFVFVKTTHYKGNGTSRIKNMALFAKNLISVTKTYAKTHGKPDVILASSVHPLTMMAGIKIAKKFKVPCICEIRDLWPETLVEYGALKRSILLAKMLYRGERWVYKKADAIIFTMEGGKDYILEKGWDKERKGSIDVSKIHHINNGVDLKQFDENVKEFNIDDDDLNNNDLFKVVYTGSIRRVNNLGLLVDAAVILHQQGVDNIKILCWGAGDAVEELSNRIKKEKINTIVFKGRVDKQYVPAILMQSDLNIVHWEMSPLLRFGASYNKLFEYLAAGKPILSTVKPGYSILDRNNCGIDLDAFTPADIAKGIIEMYQLPNTDRARMERNARVAAQEYDFEVLTNKLIKVIESL